MFTSRPERLVSIPGKEGMAQSAHEERLTVPLLKRLEQRGGQGGRVLDLGFGAVPQVLPSFYSLPQVASKKGTRDLCEDTSSLLVPGRLSLRQRTAALCNSALGRMFQKRALR